MPRSLPFRSQGLRRPLAGAAVAVVCLLAGYAVLSKPAPSPEQSRSATRLARRPPDSTPPATLASTTTSTDPSTGTTTIDPSSSTSTTDPDEATGLFAAPAVAAYLRAQDSDINAALYDLHTGQLSLYRPGALEYTASIAKVDILATLLHQAQHQGGTLPEEQQDLATSMIENSDDDAATDLWTAIGQQAALDAFNDLIPLASTVGGTDGHWGGTTTTGADQVGLLRQLVQPSRILDPASQSYELALMKKVESDQAWGVSAGVPAGVAVALKNGWLPLEDDGDWQINSIGWIDGDGRDYLLAVLTKNNNTEGDGIAVIQGLSQLVWADDLSDAG